MFVFRHCLLCSHQESFLSMLWYLLFNLLNILHLLEVFPTFGSPSTRRHSKKNFFFFCLNLYVSSSHPHTDMFCCLCHPVSQTFCNFFPTYLHFLRKQRYLIFQNISHVRVKVTEVKKCRIKKKKKIINKLHFLEKMCDKNSAKPGAMVYLNQTWLKRKIHIHCLCLNTCQNACTKMCS